MSGNAPNLIDGHAYCAAEDCWNLVPDTGEDEVCTDCDEVEKVRRSPTVQALAPFGFKVDVQMSATWTYVTLTDMSVTCRCTVESVVMGDNEDGGPPLSLNEKCTLRVVVYTGEDVDDFFPFSGTVAELIRWMSQQ